jgi:hypothetical protein
VAEVEQGWLSLTVHTTGSTRESLFAWTSRRAADYIEAAVRPQPKTLAALRAQARRGPPTGSPLSRVPRIRGPRSGAELNPAAHRASASSQVLWRALTTVRPRRQPRCPWGPGSSALRQRADYSPTRRPATRAGGAPDGGTGHRAAPFRDSRPPRW